MTDELRALWVLRAALQELAAFTGDLGFCDIAAELDVLAALLWQARVREVRG